MKNAIRNERGSAIMTAMVVGVVVMVLCLMSLMVSYSLFSGVDDRELELADRELAYSVLDELDAGVTANGKYVGILDEPSEDRHFLLDGGENMPAKVRVNVLAGEKGSTRLEVVVYREEKEAFVAFRDYKKIDDVWRPVYE